MSDQLLTMLEDALGMFIFLGVELTTLFLLISFIVGVIQEFMPADKIQRILSSKSGKGYLSAAILGGVTPFCSCSTIPMLTGLLKARAGFGPTITFLFTSPLLNPIIIGLFLATFGLKITLSYALIALTVSISAGYLLERFNFAQHIRPEILGDNPPTGCSGNSQTKPQTSAAYSIGAGTDSEKAAATECGSVDTTTLSSSCGAATSLEIVTENRWHRIWQETWSQFTKVLPYLLMGIAIGAFTYGFIPADLIAAYTGSENPLAIPVAAIIGVPLYIRAEAVIPLSAALAAKGMGMGAVMALIIGSAGASLTEVILLRSMFKTPMIIAFLTVIFSMAIIAGYLFNFLF